MVTKKNEILKINLKGRNDKTADLKFSYIFESLIETCTLYDSLGLRNLKNKVLIQCWNDSSDGCLTAVFIR